MKKKLTLSLMQMFFGLNLVFNGVVSLSLALDFFSYLRHPPMHCKVDFPVHVIESPETSSSSCHGKSAQTHLKLENKPLETYGGRPIFPSHQLRCLLIVCTFVSVCDSASN